MTVPVLAKAWVVAQDVDNEALFVTLSSVYGGQGPVYSVHVGGRGPRDGVVGKFDALPTQGTHGIVGFVSGDERNGVWLCSISTQLTDASHHQPGNGASDYAAHYGGGISYRDQNGSLVEILPDGTIIQIGSTLPTFTRHTIDGNQMRQRTPFTAAERVPQTPSPFPVSITHPTNAYAVLNASGGWHVAAASGQSLVLTANGASITIDASGNVGIVAAATLTVMAANANFSGNITAIGRITGASGVILDAHQHSLSGGTGTGGPPIPGT